jgi:hypothetical protein
VSLFNRKKYSEKEETPRDILKSANSEKGIKITFQAGEDELTVFLKSNFFISAVSNNEKFSLRNRLKFSSLDENKVSENYLDHLTYNASLSLYSDNKKEIDKIYRDLNFEVYADFFERNQRYTVETSKEEGISGPQSSLQELFDYEASRNSKIQESLQILSKEHPEAFTSYLAKALKLPENSTDSDSFVYSSESVEKALEPFSGFLKTDVLDSVNHLLYSKVLVLSQEKQKPNVDLSLDQQYSFENLDIDELSKQNTELELNLIKVMRQINESKARYERDKKLSVSDDELNADKEDLLKYEESRYEINQKRLKIIDKLLSEVPESNGAKRKILENKIKAINGTHNEVFDEKEFLKKKESEEFSTDLSFGDLLFTPTFAEDEPEPKPEPKPKPAPEPKIISSDPVSEPALEPEVKLVHEALSKPEVNKVQEISESKKLSKASEKERRPKRSRRAEEERTKRQKQEISISAPSDEDFIANLFSDTKEPVNDFTLSDLEEQEREYSESFKEKEESTDSILEYPEEFSGIDLNKPLDSLVDEPDVDLFAVSAPEPEPVAKPTPVRPKNQNRPYRTPLQEILQHKKEQEALQRQKEEERQKELEIDLPDFDDGVDELPDFDEEPKAFENSENVKTEKVISLRNNDDEFDNFDNDDLPEPTETPRSFQGFGEPIDDEPIDESILNSLETDEPEKTLFDKLVDELGFDPLKDK